MRRRRLCVSWRCPIHHCQLPIGCECAICYAAYAAATCTSSLWMLGWTWHRWPCHRTSAHIWVMRWLARLRRSVSLSRPFEREIGWCGGGGRMTVWRAVVQSCARPAPEVTGYCARWLLSRGSTIQLGVGSVILSSLLPQAWCRCQATCRTSWLEATTPDTAPPRYWRR